MFGVEQPQVKILYKNLFLPRFLLIGVIKFDDIVSFKLFFSILVIIKAIVVDQVVEVLSSENHISYIR